MKKFRLPAAFSQLKQKIHRPRLTKKRVLIASGVMMVILLAIPIGTYAYFSKDIADKERLMNRNSTGFVLLDRDGETIYSYGRTSHDNDATLDEISDFTEQAVIASEDEGFYEHQGFSVRGIASALRTNVLSQNATRQGGSTLTQQLVKNNLLSADKNFLRKYQEVSMAIAIERHYSKTEILEMYLNSVYFGEGAFGIQQAAETYFDKPASDLTLPESAMLVGLLPAPSAYSPISGDTEKAEQQQERVLRRMVEAGDISQTQMDTVIDEPLAFNESTTEAQGDAQHFTAMVMEELREKYDEETILRSGFEVRTTLDLDWQQQAEESVRQRISEIRSQGATNASLVAIDPKTGEVRALVGSVDWNDPDFGKVNMAVRPRQPGSSFKPIFYTEALERKLITAATIIEDKPTTYGVDYEPQNYDRRFRGDVSVRNALAQSLNIPAVEVMQKLGPREAAAAAQRLGISDVNEPDKYGLSLGLGTAETKLLDMTNAYAALANAGTQFTPTLITSITDKFDREVFTSKPTGQQVMSPEASYITSSILSDNNARAPVFGSRLNIRGRQVAVKTGTTNDNRDAWTIGYTPSLAIGVWVGDNNNNPMSNIAGSSGAGPIWSGSMVAFLADSPAEEFVAPANITRLRVCSSNGERAEDSGPGTYEEVFIKGTEPTGTCRRQPEPQPEAKPEEDEDQPDAQNPNRRRDRNPDRDQDESEDEETPNPLEPDPEDPPEEGEEEDEDDSSQVSDDQTAHQGI